MKKALLLNAALMVSACFCQGATITVGTPNYNPLVGVTLAPRFGTYINFDNLPGFSTVAPNAYAALGVQSITSNTAGNALIADPFSLQSAPNSLTTASAVAGRATGGITITFSNPVNTVGIGLLESDGLPDTLTVLGASGNVLGAFTVTVPLSSPTPFAAYYVISETTADIRSLVISSAAGNFGIDDLQFASGPSNPIPEPANLTLLAGGLLFLSLLRARKMKAVNQA